DAPAPAVASRPSNATSAAETRARRRRRFITVPASDDASDGKSVRGVVLARPQELVDEDSCAEAGRYGGDERAPPRHALACKPLGDGLSRCRRHGELRRLLGLVARLPDCALGLALERLGVALQLGAAAAGAISGGRLRAAHRLVHLALEALCPISHVDPFRWSGLKVENGRGAGLGAVRAGFASMQRAAAPRCPRGRRYCQGSSRR